MTHRGRHRIYVSPLHLAATFAVIILPALYFLLFTNVAHLSGRELVDDIALSLARMVAAYVLATALAWIFSVSFYTGRRALVALPVFDVLQSFPTFAALPLAALIWGAGNGTIIFFLGLNILWPVFFSIVSSLKMIRRDWAEAVALYGVSGMAYVRRFLIPVTLPGLITGSIIGLGDGWEALIATEIIVHATTGLGQFFNAFSSNVAITGFGIVGFLLIIFSINKLIWLPLLEWSHRLTDE